MCHFYVKCNIARVSRLPERAASSRNPYRTLDTALRRSGYLVQQEIQR